MITVCRDQPKRALVAGDGIDRQTGAVVGGLPGSGLVLFVE
jgi:hypothetical protein